MNASDDVAALVIDVGSSTVKMGFAGEDTPKAVFPSVLGRGDPPCVGTVALTQGREGVDVTPVFQGNAVNWTVLEELWSYGLKTRLMVDPREHPLLHAVSPVCEDATRLTMTELAFETLAVPAFFLAKNPVLSCFALGRETGLVIDSGAHGTVASCVTEGYALRSTVVHSAYGGSALSHAVAQELDRRNVQVLPRFAVKRTEVKPGEFSVALTQQNATESYRQFAVGEVVRDLKESMCRVSPDPWDPLRNANVPTSTYELPDGNVITFGAEKFTLTEPMFAPAPHPGAMDEDGDDSVPLSIPALAVRSVSLADVDVQREMYANIVLTGGNSLLPHFAERLTTELGNVLAPQMYKINVVAGNFSVERRFSTFIGGSILASLGTFQQLWISRQEYEETGSSVVQQKCP